MPTLDEAALYGTAGRFVEAVLPVSEASAAPLLIQYLTLVGSAIGRGPHFRAGADAHYTNVYSLIIGPTSSGAKGTSYGFAKDIVFAADSEWAETCVASGLSTAEGLIFHVRDAVYEEGGPRVEQGASQGTMKIKLGEVIDAGVSDKRLMVIEREFSSMLRRSNNRENTLSSTLRNAWDGDPLGTLTRNNSMRAHNAHVSLIGHITPQELSRDFDETELFNGFLNRVLVAWSERSKLLPSGGQVDPTIRARLIGETRSAIEFARSVREMRRTDAAEARWVELYPELTKNLPGLLGAAGARRHVHVMKLALLYALLDQCAEIDVKHLNAALAVWKYCEASLVELFGDAVGDHLADKVLQALRASSPNPLSLSQLRDATGRNYSAEQMTTALSTLASFGLADQTPAAPGARGRPAERWNATVKDGNT